MRLYTSLTIIIARLARKLLRLLGRGGTNVPGTIALKMNPKIIGALSKDIKIILVTGTNGKTTITRIIEEILIKSGKTYFTNKSGANMDTGIAAEFVINSSLLGKCKYDYALIECDELAFKYVSRYAKINYIVVSNIFRDQLDRYGEITHTLTGIYEGIKNVPDAKVCLNADCSLSVSLKDRISNEVIFYGLNCPIYKERVAEVSDAPYCIKCGSEYEYDFVTYGHLGAFKCKKCGYASPEKLVSTEEIINSTVDSSDIILKIADKKYEVMVNLPGGYNVYNATAAAAIGFAAGFKNEDIISALASFSCGFGRMEKFHINDTDIRMILVKNPAGANQVLNFVCNITEPSTFVVGLNDRYADGTDISWIWDADFEKLTDLGDNLHKVIVTGTRADDMALRFKYAGIPTDKITIDTDYNKLIEDIVSDPTPAFIMPTYTAMLDIREVFSKTYNYKDFWK